MRVLIGFCVATAICSVAGWAHETVTGEKDSMDAGFWLVAIWPVLFLCSMACLSNGAARGGPRD